MRIDLHMHSTASDGAYSPREVVGIAHRHQMDVIALTDHDTVAGVEEAIHTADPGLTVLCGVELATEHVSISPTTGTSKGAERHILGYFRGMITDPDFLKLLEQLQFNRVGRAQKIVANLRDQGLAITFESVQKIAGDAAIGRPHIAQALLQIGAVSSAQDAFIRYIGDDRPAYVPHQPISPQAAIAAIHAAHGVAVLAHPGHYGHPEQLIGELAEVGLDGVEAYYYDHTPPMVRDFVRAAAQHNLIVTVGSDFHRREGDGSARIGSVSARNPEQIYEDLISRLT